MSSSSVCQGLQSCLEPLLMEPCVLRLKLAPPKSNFSRSTASNSCITSLDNLKKESHREENNTTITSNTNKITISDDCDVKSDQVVDIGGWNFLQFVNNPSHNTTEKDKVYVHPLVKRSASTLSTKSLEMCTESLGSETGSQVSQSSDDISLISSETGIRTTKKPSKLCQSFVTNRTNRSFNFPPPLTSISGSTGVQVRPHREGGRLVLQAVTVSTSYSCFHAERSDGRLRLSLMRDCSPNMENNEEDAEEEEEEEEEEEGQEEYGEEEFDDGEKEIENKEIICDEEEGEAYRREDIEGNTGKVRGQIGVEKLSTTSSCKEGGRGNKELLNWEPFWVAT